MARGGKIGPFDKVTAAVNMIIQGLEKLDVELTAALAKVQEQAKTSDPKVIEELQNANKLQGEDLAQTRKDTAKWLAALEHKIAEQAEGQLQIVTETTPAYDDKKVWNGIESLAERIQTIEDLLTGPQAPETNPPTDPALSHVTPINKDNTTLTDDTRVRTTPYQRLPRPKAREHVLEVVNDGRWHNVNTLANKKGKTHSPAWRYWRGLYQTHLRELYQEGVLERRDSNMRGVIYEYKLRTKPPTNHK